MVCSISSPAHTLCHIGGAVYPLLQTKYDNMSLLLRTVCVCMCACVSAGTFSLWCHPKFEDRCHSVVEFIERAIVHSKNGRFLYFLRSRVPGEFALAVRYLPYSQKLNETFTFMLFLKTDHLTHNHSFTTNPSNLLQTHWNIITS